MAGHTLKNLVSRRRRASGEEEDDESVTMVDDSQSEGSVPSDSDAEADGEASEISDTDATEHAASESARDQSPEADRKSKSKSKRSRKPKQVKDEPSTSISQETKATFTATADTQAMMNGIRIGEAGAQADVVDFETVSEQVTAKPTTSNTQPSIARSESMADRRRREHEEYKKKRDTDPTFIPNRGNFFMHDPRTPDQRGFAPSGRGRGRGRGFVGGPFSPAAQMAQAEKAADAPWAHDLHETLNEPNHRSGAPGAPVRAIDSPQAAAIAGSDPVPKAPISAQRPSNFSSTIQLGIVQSRVNLPGMKAMIPFTGVPIKAHTRSPDHRPPLRRDKPVRVSLPDHEPRYVFPSPDRSFIFIPRALRPNQQGSGRGRGSFGGFGGFGGYASRRTSVYGGSVYAPSVMSRRSSLAHEISRESAFSPTGSVGTRHSMSRPVVRSPQGVPYHSNAVSPAGSMSARAPQGYPLPQKPAVTHYPEDVTMHQPRPQKTISVTGIESPASLALHAPQQQNQIPFQNQLPQHISENPNSQPGAESAPPAFYPQQYPYPGQVSTGTPLSNIPERAIHAQPFQPPAAAYGQPAYYPYAQPGYYYPPQGMPMFVPPQPAYGIPPAPAQSSQAPAALGDGLQQANMLAHESNGMVFYYDPAQTTQYPQSQYPAQEGYLHPPSYAVPGMGGMMTPSPDTSAAYYYPQVPPAPVYYPQQ